MKLLSDEPLRLAKLQSVCSGEFHLASVIRSASQELGNI